LSGTFCILLHFFLSSTIYWNQNVNHSSIISTQRDTKIMVQISSLLTIGHKFQSNIENVELNFLLKSLSFIVILELCIVNILFKNYQLIIVSYIISSLITVIKNCILPKYKSNYDHLIKKHLLVKIFYELKWLIHFKGIFWNFQISIIIISQRFLMRSTILMKSFSLSNISILLLGFLWDLFGTIAAVRWIDFISHHVICFSFWDIFLFENVTHLLHGYPFLGIKWNVDTHPILANFNKIRCCFFKIK